MVPVADRVVVSSVVGCLRLRDLPLKVGLALLLSVVEVAATEPPAESEHEFTFVVLGDSQSNLPNKFN